VHQATFAPPQTLSFLKTAEMKKIIMALAMLLTGAYYLSVQCVKPAGVRVQQIVQHKKIKQGIASGKLTGREAAHLKGQQAYIQRAKRKAMRDGVLTRGERLRIKSEQAKASHYLRAKA
jgi:hypothetical protein